MRYLREQLAKVSGDVDRYVTVLAEDLVNADRLNGLIECCHHDLDVSGYVDLLGGQAGRPLRR